MNFWTLPPEINSERMYSGPGSGPMIEAAMAWHGLAAQLYDAAAGYGWVTSTLADTWQGAAAMAMNQPAAPYIHWLYATAARAEHTASQAEAAASAHESAFAAMVPPPVVKSNRALRMSLAASNCLGQSSPAIADADAEYEQMWAQDIDAMHGYAGASADATTLTPFTSPPATTAGATRQVAGVFHGPGWSAAIAAAEIISAGIQLMSAVPRALQSLCSSPLASLDASLSSVSSSLSKLSSLSAPLDFAINHLNCLNKAAALRSLLPNSGSARGPTFTAKLGRGTSIGRLSVPPAWAKSSTVSRVTVQLQRGWVCEPIHLVEDSEPPMSPSGV